MQDCPPLVLALASNSMFLSSCLLPNWTLTSPHNNLCWPKAPISTSTSILPLLLLLLLLLYLLTATAQTSPHRDEEIGIRRRVVRNRELRQVVVANKERGRAVGLEWRGILDRLMTKHGDGSLPGVIFQIVMAYVVVHSSGRWRGTTSSV